MRLLQDPNTLIPVVGFAVIVTAMLVWAVVKVDRAWKNHDYKPLSTGERSDFAADHEGAMREALLGRWSWVAAVLVITIPAVLAILGRLGDVNFGLVSFFGTLGVFATRFAFTSNQTLTRPKMVSLIGLKNPLAARLCLVLLASFCWLAVIVAFL